MYIQNEDDQKVLSLKVSSNKIRIVNHGKLRSSISIQHEVFNRSSVDCMVIPIWNTMASILSRIRDEVVLGAIVTVLISSTKPEHIVRIQI